MVSVGGGGAGMPMSGGPLEMLITLVVLVGIGWVAYRIFS